MSKSRSTAARHRINVIGRRHLVQIGTVDAAEINQVVEWLAGIVGEEALPQKLLVLHQFKFSMITNRRQVRTPPEPAVLIHMDGQCPLSTKWPSGQVTDSHVQEGSDSEAAARAARAARPRPERETTFCNSKSSPIRAASCSSVR